MKSLGIKLDLLADILLEKKEALIQIGNICENQEYVIKELAAGDRASIINEMNIEKQNLIDTVIKCDRVFQSTFDSIKDIYQEHIEIFRDKYVALQTLIKEVVDLDIRIRNIETRNKNVVNAEKQAIKLSPSNKNYLIKQYQKNNKM